MPSRFGMSGCAVDYMVALYLHYVCIEHRASLAIATNAGCHVHAMTFTVRESRLIFRR